MRYNANLISESKKGVTLEYYRQTFCTNDKDCSIRRSLIFTGTQHHRMVYLFIKNIFYMNSISTNDRDVNNFKNEYSRPPPPSVNI